MKTIANAMKYEKTGKIKSKRQDIVRGEFKEMSSSEIVWGSVRELYGRYEAEVWITLFVMSWAIFIGSKLS